MAVSPNSPSPEAHAAARPVGAAVARCLQRHVLAGQTVCVALSGGIDSVVLLHALREAGGDHLLSAVHVDHGLQAASGEWAEFCRRLCADWQVPLTIARVEVERSDPHGTEAAARCARHAVYARCEADWLALGHQRGDRAETLLINLLRGCGVRGAAAMPARRGRLLRPLIDCSRAQIAGYAAAFGLRWVEDGSNADTDFRRNFLRHDILPRLAARIPAAEAMLAAAAERFGEAQDLLDALARLDLGERPAEFPFDVAPLRRLDEARANNLLRYLLRRHGVGIASERRLREFLRQLRSAMPDRHPEVRFGPHRLRLAQGRLSLLRDNPSVPRQETNG